MTAQPVTAAPMVEVPFGLGAAAGTAAVFMPPTDELDPSGRWRNKFGFGIEGPACTPAILRGGGDLCAPDTLDPDLYAPLYSSQEALPFYLEAGVRCSPFGLDGDLMATFHQAADRQLELVRWAEVANELWTGAKQPGNRRLAHPDATVLSDHPVDIVEAVSLLEDAFSSYVAGGPRLMHAPTRLAAYLATKALVTAQGAKFTTLLGSQVIVDDGYPGTDPAGALEPGVAWMYGTGPLTARIDPSIAHPEPELVDAFRTGDNTILVRAEQYAAVTWLCGHFAVPIRLCD